MSITKAVLYENTGDAPKDRITSINKLYNYLKENAVPDYFDSVELKEEYPNFDYKVLCKKGNRTILTFFANGNYSKYYVISDLSPTYSFSYGSKTNCIDHVYKCNNGFLFVMADSSNASGDKGSISITKDNEGNLTLIIADSLMVKQNATSKICVINEHTDVSAYNTVYYDCSDSAMSNYQTVIAPLPVCGSSIGYFYTPNAYIMPFSQISQPGKIDINGSKYITNGLWCIKD